MGVGEQQEEDGVGETEEGLLVVGCWLVVFVCCSGRRSGVCEWHCCGSGKVGGIVGWYILVGSRSLRVASSLLLLQIKVYHDKGTLFLFLCHVQQHMLWGGQAELMYNKDECGKLVGVWRVSKRRSVRRGVECVLAGKEVGESV